MPGITREQYEGSLRDKTCVVDGERCPRWWVLLFRGGWDRCESCKALHCRDHHEKVFKHGYFFFMRREWECRYCGKVNKDPYGGRGG